MRTFAFYADKRGIFSALYLYSGNKDGADNQKPASNVLPLAG
jgi:hypothetical protein